MVRKKANRVNRPKSILQEELALYLKEFYDNNSQVYISDAVDELITHFAGLENNKSRIHEFIKECNSTFKRPTFHSEKRNSDDNLILRKEWVQR
jgi:hypothetical protein